MPVSLKTLVPVAAVSLLASSACGYVGLEQMEQAELVNPEHQPPSSGGATIGEGGAVGTGAADNSESGGTTSSGGSSGGNDGSGGDDSTGSSGGTASELPGYPCSTDCAEPFLVFRTLEVGVLGVPKVSNGSVVERSTDLVHAGDFSLIAKSTGGGSEATIDENIRTVTSGALYYRAWYFIPEGTVNDWLKTAGFHGTSSGGPSVVVAAEGVIKVNVPDSSASIDSAPKSYPSGEWFCLQADLFVGVSAGSLKVRINGTSVASLDQVDTLPQTGVARVAYGIDATGPNQIAAKIYVDDIVASTEPVGCD